MAIEKTKGGVKRRREHRVIDGVSSKMAGEGQSSYGVALSYAGKVKLVYLEQGKELPWV